MIGSGSNKEQVRGHSTHAQSLETYLENARILPYGVSAEMRETELQSDSHILIKRMLVLAQQHCRDRGISSGSKRSFSLYDEAYEIATSITNAYEGVTIREGDKAACAPDQIKRRLALSIPSSASNLFEYVKENGKLGVQQDELSYHVANYTKGRLKSSEVDRSLALALTHAEIAAYLDEMLWKNPITNTSRLEDAKPHGIGRFMWGAIKAMLILWSVAACVTAIPIFFPSPWFSSYVAIALGIGAVGSIAILAFYGLVALLVHRDRPRQLRNHEAILGMMDRMNAFYQEFSANAPISTAHFRKRVEELAEAGVIWPGGIFVLLDDMEYRQVRFF